MVVQEMNVRYKKIIFIPVILGVMILSLVLVKQNQETRRGAAGTAKAVLIMSPEKVGVSIDDKFEVNVVVSVEATMSATKLLVCHSPNVELEKQETELISFNVYSNQVSDQNSEKCSEIVMTGMTTSDKLPSQYFKLIKMGFVAKSVGTGVIKIIGENSNMVGVGGEIAIDTDINSVAVDVYSPTPTCTQPLPSSGEQPTGEVTKMPIEQYWRCNKEAKVCYRVEKPECDVNVDCIVSDGCPVGYSCEAMLPQECFDNKGKMFVSGQIFCKDDSILAKCGLNYHEYITIEDCSTSDKVCSDSACRSKNEVTIIPTCGVTVTSTPVIDREWWTCDENNKCIVGTYICNSEKALAGKCFYGTDCPVGFCDGSCAKCEDEVTGYTGPNKRNGDFNCDGRVDGADYVLWRNEFIDKIFGAKMEADGNCDGKVTVIDYSIWREWYLK